MATTPTQNAVPSELPQDLKFNAGKIDEFVTSLAMKYIDRLGGEHYTIEGIKQLAFDAMSAFGYVTISSFEDGATLTNPNQALLWENNGEYYKWTGNLPKTVPAGSTPDSTGGIGPGAWLSIGDSLLRSMLASSTGAQLIGTNHRGTLQADLDKMDNRTSGQTIANLQANTGDIVVDSTISEQINPLAKSNTFGCSGGEVVVPKTKVGLLLDKKRSIVEGLQVRGDGTVAYEDTVPTYASIIREEDAIVRGSYLKDATMGFLLQNNPRHIKLIGNTTENMTSHPLVGTTNPVSAGGYGVCTEGVWDLLIDGHTFKGTNVADRHGVYISEDASNLRQNRYVRIVNCFFDYSGAWGGDKPEKVSPMLFGRGNSVVSIHNNQFTGGGYGISFTDERQSYEMISITNNTLHNIRKNSDAECIGIALQQAGAGRDKQGFIVSGNMITMTDGGKGYTRANQRAIQLAGSRWANVCDNYISSPGAAPAIRLVGGRNITISNITAITNDGLDASAAVALIEFSFSVANVIASGLNVTGRSKLFSGLDDVSNLQVDFARKARVTVTNGTAVVTSDPWELVKTISVTSSSITVAYKGHVTQGAADGAVIRPVSGNQIILSGTDAKTAGMVVFTMPGAAVNPSTGSYIFDIILSC